MSTSSLLAFFKNEALLKLGFLAVMLVLLYDSLWGSESNKTTPPATPTAIVQPTALPTPNQTEVGEPTYFCYAWTHTNEEGESQTIYICETE